jgi:integrase
MKAGLEHRVPLSDRAVEILKAMKQRATGKLVFGGGVEGRPISDTAMTKALRAAAGDDTVTLHGLRSSFRDWAGDCTHHPRDVCEAALAHIIQGVEAAYRRSDALAKRKVLMEDWAAYLGARK